MAGAATAAKAADRAIVYGDSIDSGSVARPDCTARMGAARVEEANRIVERVGIPVPALRVIGSAVLIPPGSGVQNLP